MSESVVSNNRQRLRYEISVDGELAGFAQYRDRAGVRTFVHTEIDERFEGRGLASSLIRNALADVRAHGRTIAVECPFVGSYLARHPEEQDLLAPGTTLPDADRGR
jgi:predicted GNAT family acetyltransferase